jgi:tagatose 6-phosphate kinase
MHICLGTTPTVQQTMVFQRVASDEVNRATQVIRAASGKPINVARVLHTLGEPSRVCIPVGGDTGRFICEDLSRDGIDHDCAPAENPTRTCVTVIDENAETATELVEEHAPISASVAGDLIARLQKYLPEARTLILSGTLAPGVGDDFYSKCCAMAANAKVPVILDAHGPPLARALRWQPLVVKPNRQELAKMLGEDLDDEPSLRRAMNRLHEQGAQYVVITMGKDGAFAFDGAGFWKIPAIPVAAISPIGSGDAFAAGLVAGIAGGRNVIDACRLGSACAAANTLTIGAGNLKIEDVRRLEPLARVERQ